MSALGVRSITAQRTLVRSAAELRAALHLPEAGPVESAVGARADAAQAEADERSGAACNSESFEILRRHSDPESCWIVVNGRVLDVTSYLGHHPGGRDVLTRYAGRDATAAFAAAGHSHAAVMKCADFDVGPLSDAARLRRASDAAVAHKARLRAIAHFLE